LVRRDVLFIVRTIAISLRQRPDYFNWLTHIE
jgi:hypothetical protein